MNRLLKLNDKTKFFTASPYYRTVALAVYIVLCWKTSYGHSEGKKLAPGTKEVETESIAIDFASLPLGEDLQGSKDNHNNGKYQEIVASMHKLASQRTFSNGRSVREIDEQRLLSKEQVAMMFVNFPNIKNPRT